MSASDSSTADAFADLLKAHAVTLVRLGRHAQAERCVSSLVRDRASPQMYSLLGKIQAQQGRWEDARASLRLALELDGRCEEASLALAAIASRRTRALATGAATAAAVLGVGVVLTACWVHLAQRREPTMLQVVPPPAMPATAVRQAAGLPAIDLAAIETIATLFLKFEPFRSQFGLQASAVQVGSELAFSIRGTVPTQQVIGDLRRAVAANGMAVQTTDIRVDQIYAVKPNETLHSVARIVYGDARGWPVLWRANQLKSNSPHLISPGQILKVPAWQPGRQTP